MMNKVNSLGLTNFDDIKVYKNIFCQSEITKIQEYISQPNWKFGHYSDSFSKHKKFWNMDLTDVSYFQKHLFYTIRDIISQETCSVQRIYANGQTYGLDGSFHIDDINGYTFLYYANEVWKPDWAGDTIFYDSKTNQKKSFHYESNSAILFPGNIFHYGQSPSRDFYGLRVTIAYKLFFGEQQ